MGPSGSGKSTLMHILAGLDRPTAGSVVIDGIDITELDDNELTKLRREHIGFVFQFFNLLPMLTRGGEHHAAARDRRREAGPGVARGAPRAGRPRRPPHAPAGRALRRPAAARRDRPRAASPGRPSCSPTSRPATSTRRPSAEILELLPRGGRATTARRLVMVTHDARAATIADRVLFLADGRIVKRRSGRSTAARDPRRDRGSEPAMTARRAQGASRAASSARSSRPSRSCSASPWSAARSSSPTRSQSAFDQIFTGSYENTDAVVTGKPIVVVRASGSPTVPRRRCSRRSRALAGVADGGGPIFDLTAAPTTAKLIGRDGKAIGTSGNPTFGVRRRPGTSRASTR